jgi:hypothetical protein
MVDHIVTYSINEVIRGQKGLFKDTVKNVLKELQSELQLNVIYKEVKTGGNIVINLIPQTEVDKHCGSLKDQELSCSIRKKTDTIYFSYNNWISGAKFEGSLSEYRSYLIKHEFLHCYPFYLDHPSKTILRKYCRLYNFLPIMYQQTKGPIDNCKNSSKYLPP